MGTSLCRIALMASLGFTSACYRPFAIENYDPATPPVEGPAILENGFGRCPYCVREIIEIISEQDSRVVYDAETHSAGEATTFRLLPGRYLITYQYRIPDSGFTWAQRQDFVEFKARHTYRARREHCRREKTGWEATVWIEDKTTGQVIAGTKWQASRWDRKCIDAS